MDFQIVGDLFWPSIDEFPGLGKHEFAQERILGVPGLGHVHVDGGANEENAFYIYETLTLSLL